MCKTRLLLFVAAVMMIVNKIEVYAAAVGKKCPENEFYTACGANCQTECATLHKPCLIRHIKCPSDCYCCDGFARDASGKCVRIENCVKNWALIAGRTY